MNASHISSISYEKWGGFAATVSELDDMVAIRQTDPKLAALLYKLDMLERAPHDMQGIIDAVNICSFTGDDLNRLNSPLLDGLFAILSGCSTAHPFDEQNQLRPTPLSKPESLQDMVLRGVEIDVHPSTIAFLLDHGANSAECVDDALVAACEHGRLQLVELLLSRGANAATLVVDPEAQRVNDRLFPNEVKHDIEPRRRVLPKVTLVEIAAAAGHDDILRALFAHEPGLRMLAGPALLKASEHSHANVVAFLVTLGATVVAPPFGLLALAQSASVTGCRPIVKSLLDAGVATGAKLEEVLIDAVEADQFEVVEELLSRGVDAAARENRALMVAAMRGNSDIIELLLNHGADVHAHDDRALEHTLSAGRAAALDLLLQRGANRRKLTVLSLMDAVDRGFAALVDVLLKHGLSDSINVGDSRALRTAAENGKKALAAVLLKHGADAHGSSDYALRIAASRGHTPLVALLLEHGADVHAVGDEALFYAAKQGHEATVAVLLKHGADANARRGDVLSVATPGVLQLLQAHIASANSVAHGVA